MMQWNLNSNASDVLSLGPRTAGRLATVGIRSVAELLTAKPQAIARRLQDRSLSAEFLTAWQGEARLILDLPELPAEAARMLAAAEIGGADRLRLCTPTELLAAIETAQRDASESWFAAAELPSIGELTEWILLAQLSEKSFAA